MLTAEERMELEILGKHGAGIRELARAPGGRAIRCGDIFVRARQQRYAKPVPKRAEKLDRFKAYIVDRMKAATPDRDPGHRSLSRDQGAR